MILGFTAVRISGAHAADELGADLPAETLSQSKVNAKIINTSKGYIVILFIIRIRL
jgi:hypothetical protein